ncbi:MAG: HDIG domain-containing protein [Candidatus Omnitrophica bacterium]|nr:HDIG domain-containing protein [Candidatus Omnitrophota bacterium]
MKIEALINRVLAVIVLSAILLAGSKILGINPVAVIFIIIISLYLIFNYKNSENFTKKILNIILILLIFLFIADTVIKNKLPFYLIPFSTVSMLITILFLELHLSLLVSITLSILLVLDAGNDPYLGIMMLNSSIVSSLLVLGIRRRSKIIKAGFICGLIQVATFFFIDNFIVRSFIPYIFFFLNGFICGIIVAGILPIFEYLSGVITNISLLELADFNNPLLKRLMLEAPGTYHHSLIVGNLAEAAAEVVGANSLLARIGAYYHDIGKIKNAEYFSENQLSLTQKHEKIPPSISKLIIINHVKEGLDLAKKYKLNPRIIDFILQHHGTSLVYYFYLKALENIEPDVVTSTEEEYRYPGPKPNSKETAIVLLADSAEAASRSLKEVSASKIEELVHRVINNKFIDGQLDHCELTLRDLDEIAKVFTRILISIYHARITYPDKKESS